MSRSSKNGSRQSKKSTSRKVKQPEQPLDPMGELSAKQSAFLEEIKQLSDGNVEAVYLGRPDHCHEVIATLDNDSEEQIMDLDDRKPALPQLVAETRRLANHAANVAVIVAGKQSGELATIVDEDRPFWVAYDAELFERGVRLPLGIEPQEDTAMYSEAVFEEMYFRPLESAERFVVVTTTWDLKRTLGHPNCSDGPEERGEWERDRLERRARLSLPTSFVDLPPDEQVFADVNHDDVRPMTRDAALFRVAHLNQLVIQDSGGVAHVGMQWSFLVELGEPLGDSKGNLQTVMWHRGHGKLAFRTMHPVQVVTPTKAERSLFRFGNTYFCHSNPSGLEDAKYFAGRFRDDIDIQWGRDVIKVCVVSEEVNIVVNSRAPFRMQLHSEFRRVADWFERMALEIYDCDSSPGEQSLDPLEEPRIADDLTRWAKAIQERKAVKQ